MPRFFRFVIPALLAALSLLAALPFGQTPRADADDAATQPSVGDKAPDFTLNTIQDKPIQLSKLIVSGPVVIVQLRGWVGYQCPLCTLQVADLRAHAKEFAAAKAHVVLVYPGPADELKTHASDFIGGKGLPEGFEFVIDPDLKFVNAWGLRWNPPKENAYPATFVVDTQNIVRYKKVSKSHGDRASASQILEALAKKDDK